VAHPNRATVNTADRRNSTLVVTDRKLVLVDRVGKVDTVRQATAEVLPVGMDSRLDMVDQPRDTMAAQAIMTTTNIIRLVLVPKHKRCVS
jgi:hypothetical protein